MDTSSVNLHSNYTDHTDQTQSRIASVSTPSARTARREASASQSTQDTVQLSTTAHVKALRESGESVDQIAADIPLPASEVNQDLGFSSGSSASETAVLSALSARF